MRILVSKKDIDYSVYQKDCIGCKRVLPANMYYRHNGSRDGLNPYCRECSSLRTKLYWKNNKEALSKKNKEWVASHRKDICENKKKYYKENRRAARNWQLNKSFGITIERYEKMLLEQGGVCAICGGDSGIKNRCHAVDHNHTTRKVRGLGFVWERESILMSYIEYLRKWEIATTDVMKRSREVAGGLVLGLSVKVRILREQRFSCVVCNGTISEEFATVDHCHKSGMVRGILCNHCNMGLGSFKDSVDIIEKAIAYLSKHAG